MSDGRLRLIGFTEAAALECTPYQHRDFKTAFTDALRTRGIWLGCNALDDIHDIIGQGAKAWLKQRAKTQGVKARSYRGLEGIDNETADGTR